MHPYTTRQEGPAGRIGFKGVDALLNVYRDKNK